MNFCHNVTTVLGTVALLICTDELHENNTAAKENVATHRTAEGNIVVPWEALRMLFSSIPFTDEQCYTWKSQGILCTRSWGRRNADI